MASEEQLEILQQDPEMWNAWRIRNPEIAVDLRGAKLYRTQLDGTNLGNVDLSNANLYGASLKEANLQYADLSRTDLRGARLVKADLHGAILYRANLGDVKVYSAKTSFSDDSIELDIFEDEEGNWVYGETGIQASDLRDADLQQADIREANFSKAFLQGVNFSQANLSGADLSGANLSRANLRRAILNKTVLREAVLQAADLREADLGNANLLMADLYETDFRNSILGGADLFGAKFFHTYLNGIDLSQANGLEMVNHVGPSSIGVDTIFYSKGEIPEIFLQGCGVPQIMIAFSRSIQGMTLDFYSCFISHSAKDKRFCERLHGDLQAKGVRVWLFEEDAKWGETVWGEIDRSIKVYDKLVVVLSEDSLQSGPVSREIQRALNREDAEHKSVLFPITLDRYVFDTWEHERKADVLHKVVGDFSGWDKDTARYNKAFDKLLRGLQAGQ